MGDVLAFRRPDDEPHTDDVSTADVVGAPDDPRGRFDDERVANFLSFVRRRISGDYEVDDFGLDTDLSDNVLLQPFRLLYEHWFKIHVQGLDNIPGEGAAMVAANHAGTVAMDAVMAQVAILDHHPAQRRLRVLGGDFMFGLPFASHFARATGSTLACRADTDRLLAGGELVGVFPEGYKGVGKHFNDRYHLQRFGRGGFVRAALKARAPIVPCAIVGSEEIYPLLGDIAPLARLFGLPYFPVTPTFPWLGPLGAVPLPSRWIIEFGEPIDTSAFDDGAAEDPALILDLTDQVRETIQSALPRLLEQRGSVFGT